MRQNRDTLKSMAVEYYVVIKNAVQVLFKNTPESPLQINHASIPSVRKTPRYLCRSVSASLSYCPLKSPASN